MRLREFFGRLKRSRLTDHSALIHQKLDELLATSSRRLGAVDPQTKQHWRNLQRALARAEDFGTVERITTSSPFRRPAFAIAVVACVLAVFGVLWLFRPSIGTYETGRGQQMSIVLEDSSEVILNHTSQLSVTHAPLGKARLVSLRGEAYFHVRHNGLPFIITTELGTVKVMGTEFDVRARERQMEVGVVRGSVQVTCKSGGTDSSLTLSGDQIVACAGSGFLGGPSSIPFPEYPGWVHGKLVFFRTDLRSVCEELESRCDVIIAIREPRLNKSTITGAMDAQNIDSALLSLTRLTGSKFRREGNTYTVY